jgi:exo-beta-1,3-glucanase (GH17 family)
MRLTVDLWKPPGTFGVEQHWGIVDVDEDVF